MSDENIPLKSNGTSFIPPIVLAVIAAAMISGALDFGTTARRLPLLIGSATLALIVIDFLSRFENSVGRFLRAAIGADFRDPEMQHTPRWQAEITQVSCLALVLGGIVIFGFLAAIPSFIFFYMLVQGKQSILRSALVSTGIVVLIAMLFEIILDYDLYRGVLFDSND
ncbi:MAG: hypothetical protein HKN77_05500 [Woeseiaceae bacterium]|nr:hypothetical protein [Woeseiaceae bacterium]